MEPDNLRRSWSRYAGHLALAPRGFMISGISCETLCWILARRRMWSGRSLVSNTIFVDPGGMLLADAESGRLEGARSGFYMLWP